MSNSNRDSHYDIAIAGGGMIGTCLALALAPLGLRIAVVEAVARKASRQPSFDDRSTALSRSTQRMFEAMGLWNEIVAASTPIRSIHVSDRGRFGFSHIDAEEQGVEALGYVVINRVLGSVLQSALQTLNGVDVICPARIVDLELAPEEARAGVEPGNGERLNLRCKLLVAADGANSSVREMMGISVQKREYGQRAVIGNLLSENKLNNRAFERFTPQGPLAVLPVADGRAGFVWAVSEHDAQRVLALDDETFLRELQEEFGYRLGAFSHAGKRASYPLALSKALRLTATRSVLIGNAAHGLHPVSAQGFNLGMRDVAALCDCIADSLADSDGIDPGDEELLQRYANWRRSDQNKLVRFTDGLVRLFGSRRRPFRTLRNLGMLGFDLIPGVRSEFAKHTMGLAGKLPRLSRGVPLR
ncbi:MAG: 2-octaprenyl-6-methoxyphenyl hydroxylase [Gammaproteobacteria bacterium]|nr:2-octaprenyl-6-methoxyphenyl hydroxylase [Gammaproteobacteria bacterium]MBU2677669.1 2-octaprenyl-6-methoxyphenyl hydroxylase [Gammaproteobacteria bacterium]NND48207.1 2-octaprenyl-6-methoxyphenyl hydroxylase [Woeseiaceae bacterium]NNL51401.1 2-octaprenyl-6-methoxyphenyl hydroxylase [Woeseiaceae bacterium]